MMGVQADMEINYDSSYASWEGIADTGTIAPEDALFDENNDTSVWSMKNRRYHGGSQVLSMYKPRQSVVLSLRDMSDVQMTPMPIMKYKPTSRLTTSWNPGNKSQI